MWEGPSRNDVSIMILSSLAVAKPFYCTNEFGVGLVCCFSLPIRLLLDYYIIKVFRKEDRIRLGWGKAKWLVFSSQKFMSNTPKWHCNLVSKCKGFEREIITFKKESWVAQWILSSEKPRDARRYSHPALLFSIWTQILFCCHVQAHRALRSSDSRSLPAIPQGDWQKGLHDYCCLFRCVRPSWMVYL